MPVLKISNVLVNGFLQFAQSRGIHIPSEMSEALLQPDQIGMIPYGNYAKIYEFVLQQSGDQYLGLHEGESYNMAALGIVGQMVQVSPDIKTALENSCTNFNLVSTAINLKFVIKANRFYLYFDLHPEAGTQFPLTSEHMVYAAMVFGLREYQFLTLKQTQPISVNITYKKNLTSEFERIFNCKPTFNSKRNYLEFDIDVLSTPIIYADFELLGILEKVTCDRLGKVPEPSSKVSIQIRHLIYTLLDPGVPAFKTVARNLNYSPRSLQRLLQKEGTSYSKILESVKKELAMDYLKQNMSIKEISYLMGYSEPSAFVNAFKKWFGQSPARFKLLL